MGEFTESFTEDISSIKDTVNELSAFEVEHAGSVAGNALQIMLDEFSSGNILEGKCCNYTYDLAFWTREDF